MHEQPQAIGTGMMDVVQMWDEATSFLGGSRKRKNSRCSGLGTRQGTITLPAMIINANHGLIVYGVWVFSSAEFRQSA